MESHLAKHSKAVGFLSEVAAEESRKGFPGAAQRLGKRLWESGSPQRLTPSLKQNSEVKSDAASWLISVLSRCP